MRVVVATGPRGEVPMGLESAEARLLAALQRAESDVRVDMRVVGARSAWRTARRTGTGWVPSVPGRMSSWVWRDADVLHLPGLDLPPPPSSVPLVVTVHDLCATRYPDEGALPPWTPDLLSQARYVLTPSGFTARQVTEQFGVPPARLRIVPNGPGQHISPSATALTEEELERLGIQRPFILRTGGYTRRKSVPLLLDAWARIPTPRPGSLVLVGPPSAAGADLRARIETLGGVRMLGYVPDALVTKLTSTAAAVVVPSSCEGFGLPLLEAMTAGTPVVALRVPFASEVCGDAALLCDPDARSLSEGLARILADEGLRGELRRRGHRRARRYSWEKAARKTLEVYRAALTTPAQS